MSEEKKALKSDWDRCEPMPKKNVVVPFCHEFSLEDYERIRCGSNPEQMEDKWFIYFEDNRLYCHRSWTGFCVYIAEFEVCEDSSKIIKVTVNRDREQYSSKNDNWDCHMLVYLINLLLLNKKTPYPEEDNVDPDIAPIKQWSQVGRAMLEEEEL